MRPFLPFALGMCLAACATHDAAGISTEIGSGEDYYPGEQWRTAAARALRIDSASLDGLLRDAGNGRFGSLHGLIVIRHGYVAAEKYFSWSADQPHTMQSVTKSITSLLFGIVHERQQSATSLDKSVVDFFPRYAGSIENMDERKRAITLRHMLSMRTGMDFYEQPYNGSPLEQLNRSTGDWVKLVLNTPMRDQPGTTWAYNSGAPIVMCGLIRERTGVNADAFARSELFAPIGVQAETWARTPYDGTPHCGGGLALRAMDLARVGYLVLRNGKWQDKQIVSKQWIQESTSPYSSGSQLIFGPYNPGYGYYWWLFPKTRGGSGSDVIAASGSGGQWLFIVPKLDLVVVMVATNGAGLDLLYELLPSVS